LEALCVGEFLSGPKSEVAEKKTKASTDPEYKDPVRTLPESPSACVKPEVECSHCEGRHSWWQRFKDTVDDLLLRSNLHIHKVDKNGNDKSYCLDAKGRCKRRFPRDTFEQTFVEQKTGALNLKKGEPWMNTITPVLTYLLRSNSDVTSLLSGTTTCGEWAIALHGRILVPVCAIHYYLIIFEHIQQVRVFCHCKIIAQSH
jgi:hypothetical protein